MKKDFAGGALLLPLILCFLSACGSTKVVTSDVGATYAGEKTPAPDWLLDLHAVYPNDTYIAAVGESDTRAGSQTEAAAALARFLRTDIAVKTQASTHAVSDENGASVSRVLDTTAAVSSSMSLSSLQYTEPYYNKKSRHWHCAAYLEREVAWNQFLPVIEKASNAFYAVLKNAQAEDDPVLKCVLYKKVQQTTPELLAALDWGRLLHPKKEAAYSEIRQLASSIPALILAERQKCTVYLAVTGDWNSTFSNALAGALTQGGFTVTKSAASAFYRAELLLDLQKSGDDPLVILPSVELTLVSKKNRTVYAKQLQAESRTVAYSLEVAQKKACPPLAQTLKDQVAAEITAMIGD